VTGAEA
jgi:hypothetical protein